NHHIQRQRYCQVQVKAGCVQCLLEGLISGSADLDGGAQGLPKQGGDLQEGGAARGEVEMAVPAIFAVSGGQQMHRRDQVRQVLGLLLCSGHGGGGEQVLELGAQAAAEQGQPEEKNQGGERQQEQNKVLHMVNGILS